jgi:hypothetical protein
MRGAPGITVDALRSHRLAAAAFDGIIKAQDDDCLEDAHGHEEPKEQPTGSAWRSGGAVQDAMIRLKVRGVAAAHALQYRRHRPLAGGEDGAREEDYHVLPNRAGKDGAKDANDTGEGDRQGEHRHPFGCREDGVSLPINCDANGDKWIKSSLARTSTLTGERK